MAIVSTLMERRRAGTGPSPTADVAKGARVDSPADRGRQRGPSQPVASRAPRLGPVRSIARALGARRFCGGLVPTLGQMSLHTARVEKIYVRTVLTGVARTRSRSRYLSRSTLRLSAHPLHPSASLAYRVLVTDEIDRDGVALLESEPLLDVDEVPTLPKAELLARIGDYDAIIGRSATRISEELLRRAARLKVVGRA